VTCVLQVGISNNSTQHTLLIAKTDQTEITCSLQHTFHCHLHTHTHTHIQTHTHTHIQRHTHIHTNKHPHITPPCHSISAPAHASAVPPPASSSALALRLCAKPAHPCVRAHAPHRGSGFGDGCLCRNNQKGLSVWLPVNSSYTNVCCI
jgi:hypothetical protein